MKNNKGFALLSVIIAFIVISLMAVFFTNFISTESVTSAEKYKSTQAYYISEGGLEYVLKRRTFPNYYLQNQQLSGGFFSVYTSSYTGSSIDLTVRGKYNNYERAIKAQVSRSSPYVKQGTFFKRNGTGLQSITGLGFQPKAVIFYWTRQTNTGFSSDVNTGFGMATSPINQSAVSITMRDNRNRSDQGRRYSSNNCIIFLTGGGPPNLEAQATFVSFDTNGFTINWITGSANQYIIHYIALGGDIQARSGNFNLTATGGIQSITGVGFQPDFVLFNWSYGNTLDTNLARSQLGIGFTTGSSNQVALVQAGSDNVGNNNDKRWWQRTDSCILGLTNGNPPAQDTRVSLVSMDVDGFTINKINPPAVTHTIFYLAIKGGQHSIGFFDQPTTNITQTISGISFQPDMAFFTSFNLIANLNEQSNGAVTIGSTVLGGNESSIWYQDRNIDPSDANMYNNYQAITMAFSNTLRGYATAVFIPSGINLMWNLCDGTQRQILYWAFRSPSPYISIRNKIEVFY